MRLRPNWDCEKIDNRPSWVQYPCLNSIEGLNLIQTMYQKVNDRCYRLDGNESVTYWLGHSPNYPGSTLIMQKGCWVRNGGVYLYEPNFSSMSWIPDSIAHENHTACSKRMNMANRHLLKPVKNESRAERKKRQTAALRDSHMILGGKPVKLPLYPSAPDPRHIMSLSA